MESKILFILPSFNAGGSENYALRFIQYCKNDPFEFHVLSLILEEGDMEDLFLKEKCILHYKRISYLNPMKFFQIYKFFIKERFDVVCTFNGNFGGVPLLISNLSGIKKRISWYRRSSNAFGENRFKKFYNKLVNYLVRHNATVILSNSRYALESFHKAYYKKDNRYKIIPNGVDAKRFRTSLSKSEARDTLNIPVDIFLVGHVGRFDPAKNHEAIFKIAAKLKDRNFNIGFLFCGKDTDGEAFEALLKTHDIKDICYNIGLTQELPMVLKTMDLFFFPSKTEGQPNALIEAMVAEIPVLASNIPPILEATPENVDTVDPYDIECALQLIVDFKNNLDLRNNAIHKNWAEEMFDYTKNFELFKLELNG